MLRCPDQRLTLTGLILDPPNSVYLSDIEMNLGVEGVVQTFFSILFSLGCIYNL